MRAHTLHIGRGVCGTWLAVAADGMDTHVAILRGCWASTPPTPPTMAQVLGPDNKPRLYLHARRGRTDTDVQVPVSCAPGAPTLMTVMVPAAVGPYCWPPGRTPVPPNAALLGSVVYGLCLHGTRIYTCLLYTSPSPRDQRGSRMPSSA